MESDFYHRTRLEGRFSEPMARKSRSYDPQNRSFSVGENQTGFSVEIPRNPEDRAQDESATSPFVTIDEAQPSQSSENSNQS